jgi:hypothetical protein
MVSAFATAVLFASGVQAAETAGAGASTDRPARGMSMEKVEAQFGAPARRVPAVGEPPITRWEYPGFTVYFEHHLVIHAVAVG